MLIMPQNNTDRVSIVVADPQIQCALFSITNSILTAFKIYLRHYKIDMSWLHYATCFYFLFCISRKSQSTQNSLLFPKKKNWASPFILIYFFFHKITPKKLYADVPAMLNSNPKTSIQEYRIFCSYYKFFTANVSDFTRIHYQKFRTLNLKISEKN